ncbi:MAG: hypothetical protein FH749_12560 [Firmicutes bacterium]|nr:hypothetical protein [Bacillota bacterium]
MWLWLFVFLFAIFACYLMVARLYILIRDFSSSERRIRNSLVVAGIAIGYFLIMITLWSTTWVGAGIF